MSNGGVKQLRCIYCGHPANETDHILVRSKGGGDEPANLAPACQSCNSAKGARSVEFFLRRHPEVLARIRCHQAGEDVLTDLLPGEKPRAGTDDTIAVTVRLPKRDWIALRTIALKSRTSLQVIGLKAILSAADAIDPAWRTVTP